MFITLTQKHHHGDYTLITLNSDHIVSFYPYSENDMFIHTVINGGAWYVYETPDEIIDALRRERARSRAIAVSEC